MSFTFVFAHKGLGRIYESCDETRVEHMIGITYVRVVGSHIQ